MEEGGERSVIGSILMLSFFLIFELQQKKKTRVKRSTYLQKWLNHSQEERFILLVQEQVKFMA